MDCSICLEAIQMCSNISILPCGHQFHALCYSYYKGYVCPMCRIPNMRKKVDTIMLNDKNLFEWTNADFSSYMKFINEKKHIVNIKRRELKEQLATEKRKKINKCVTSFYFKNLSQIRYNLLKNITSNKNEFPVLFCNFGDTYDEYPVIFLLKGPKKQKDDIEGIEYLLQLIEKNFKSFSFYIKNNRGSMCYEVIAKTCLARD